MIEEDDGRPPILVASDALMDLEVENDTLSVAQVEQLLAHASRRPPLARIKAYYEDLMAKIQVEESAKYSAADREDYLEAHEFKQRSLKLRTRASIASALMRYA